MDAWTAEKIILLSFLLNGVGCINPHINLPEKIDALSGSCVLINCTFDANITRLNNFNAQVVWSINNTRSIVLNSSMLSPNPFFKGQMLGNLSEKNCTTIFYDIRSNLSGTYNLTIINGSGKTSNMYANVTINVFESPSQPTVRLYTQKMELMQIMEVPEGSSVILRCSAKSLCSSYPPLLTWSSYPILPFNGSSIPQENQTELISDLNFTVTPLLHRTNFTCTITYQLQDKNKTAQNYFTLYVQYAPKISPSSGCKGTDVRVCFCEGHGNPSPKLTWYLSESPVSNSSCTSISEEQLGSTGFKSFFTLSCIHTANPTVLCVATNIQGSASQQFYLVPPFEETAQSEQKTLQVLLALMVFLYALTVGVALYKFKQMSNKLKAKREAESHVPFELNASNNIYENVKI
ncbi:Schwann cell myelin protein-like isoform X2 [Paramisgurnus dabryanus]